MTLKNNQALPWSVRKRLEFIEFRLFWEERINRSDLISVFDISIPQASSDFSKYQEMAPGNMIYDKKRKFYYASPNFKPVLITPSSEQYLLRYLSVSMGIIQPQKSFFGFIPPVDTVPLPWRRVEPDILKGVLHAIRYKKAIKIEYQSLTRSEKTNRWISPHALAFDGYRWHCRAFCYVDNSFKDFILGRFLQIVEEKDSEVNSEEDKGWETFVTIKIGPNPSLKETHRKIIEYEYGMINGEAFIQVRCAMLFYLLNRLDLSVEDEYKILQKRHIILLNKEEVQKALNL